jgi:hypothetical protein
MGHHKLNALVCYLLLPAAALVFSMCEIASRNPDDSDISADDDSSGGDDDDIIFDDDDDDDDNDDDIDTNMLDGCDGVDFLFIIDDSGSMGDEQQNLINSFPGFIRAITETLDLDDFHIMIVDTDDAYGNSSSSMMCSPAPCCVSWCANQSPADECAEASGPYKSCAEWNGEEDSCDHILGAGHIGANLSAQCQIDGDQRYLKKGQTDLNDTFACMAKVGIEGNGSERPMQAMIEAAGPLSGTGECNDGFIRDSAILVVTFITDEAELKEEGSSEGDPPDWKAGLVAAKGGQERNIVALGLFGDNDQADGICEEYDEEGNGAMPAPRLREFLESFPDDRRHYCSVCLPDYADCFNEAVAIIDLTCDDIIVE